MYQVSLRCGVSVRVGLVACRLQGEHRFLLVPWLSLLLGLVLACGGTATGAPTTPGETPLATTPSFIQTPGAGATLPAVPASQVVNATATPDHLASTASPSLESTPESVPKPLAGTTATPTQIPQSIDGPLVKVGDTDFQVELALTAEQQSQGLSGREVLGPGAGMLFVYEHESRYTFWMKEMRFPIDIVWIGADCKVVDVTLEAPPPEPGQSLDQLPRYSPDTPAQYVLEINAGEAAAGAIKPGDPVEFAGDLAGGYGC